MPSSCICSIYRAVAHGMSHCRAMMPNVRANLVMRGAVNFAGPIVRHLL